MFSQVYIVSYYRRATAHAADPREKKKRSKKKRGQISGWGGLSGRVRFEVSFVRTKAKPPREWNWNLEGIRRRRMRNDTS